MVGLLYGLNPMAGVVEGFRWALLGAPAPPISSSWRSSLAAVTALLVGGLFYLPPPGARFADLV